MIFLNKCKLIKCTSHLRRKPINANVCGMTAWNQITPASAHARTGGNTWHVTLVQFNNPLPSEYPFVLNCGSPSVTVTQATEQREGNGHEKKRGE